MSDLGFRVQGLGIRVLFRFTAKSLGCRAKDQELAVGTVVEYFKVELRFRGEGLWFRALSLRRFERGETPL